MELHLEGKTALVTGASQGLGLAIANALAQEGVKVAISARRAVGLESAARQIEKETGKTVCRIAADLTKTEDRKQLIKEAEAKLGQVDILVVSTGQPPTFPLSEATAERWELGRSLVLDPAIELTQGIVPGMAERNYGRLIFIGSIFGLEPDPSSVIQSTFRTGLNAFAKCVATQYGPNGVTANVICPGYFDTPLTRRLAEQYAESKRVSVEMVLDEWRDFAPSKRFGRPEDLGTFVSLLASPRGEFMNGTALTIDGGALKGY